jgi:hypothetical protein
VPILGWPKRWAASNQRGSALPFTTITSLRSLLAQRRAAGAERRRLARELACYRTPAERLELDLALGRHSAEETAEVDAILTRHATSAPYRRSA